MPTDLGVLGRFRVVSCPLLRLEFLKLQQHFDREWRNVGSAQKVAGIRHELGPLGEQPLDGNPTLFADLRELTTDGSVGSRLWTIDARFVLLTNLARSGTSILSLSTPLTIANRAVMLPLPPNHRHIALRHHEGPKSGRPTGPKTRRLIFTNHPSTGGRLEILVVIAGSRHDRLLKEEHLAEQFEFGPPM